MVFSFERINIHIFIKKRYMNIRLHLIFYGIVFLIFSCKNATDPTVETSTLVNEETVAKIDSTLHDFVEKGNVMGVSALVFENGKEVYHNAFGMADREENMPMTRNSIVQIFSMTKPITGVALMTLYEQGLFDLDDPIVKYLPEFEGQQVYAGKNDDGNVILEAPRRPITIRDLTRHTAGFVNDRNAAYIGNLLTEADPMNKENTLTQMAEKMGKIPLAFHPGEQWEYGPCVDVQALLVERISKTPFDRYIQEKILDPLEMKDTRYVVYEKDYNRLAKIYNREKEGNLNRLPDAEALAYNSNEWPLKRGGSGLTSTLDDYMKFTQMLVNNGNFNGVQILKPETVKLMATNHLLENVTERSWLPSKGNVGFGIDFAVRMSPPLNDEENFGVVGEFFWDGAASTLFWIDPVHQLTAVLFVQLFPYDQIKLHKKFRNAVYTKIIKN